MAKPAVENVAGGALQVDRAGAPGEWDFAADSGSATSLEIVIPGNASAGSYSRP
jgi:hypothetical protein